MSYNNNKEQLSRNQDEVGIIDAAMRDLQLLKLLDVVRRFAAGTTEVTERGSFKGSSSRTYKRPELLTTEGAYAMSLPGGGHRVGSVCFVSLDSPTHSEVLVFGYVDGSLAIQVFPPEVADGFMFCRDLTFADLSRYTPRSRMYSSVEDFMADIQRGISAMGFRSEGKSLSRAFSRFLSSI